MSCCRPSGSPTRRGGLAGRPRRTRAARPIGSRRSGWPGRPRDPPRALPTAGRRAGAARRHGDAPAVGAGVRPALDDRDLVVAGRGAWPRSRRRARPARRRRTGCSRSGRLPLRRWLVAARRAATQRDLDAAGARRGPTAVPVRPRRTRTGPLAAGSARRHRDSGTGCRRTAASRRSLPGQVVTRSDAVVDGVAQRLLGESAEVQPAVSRALRPADDLPARRARDAQPPGLGSCGRTRPRRPRTIEPHIVTTSAVTGTPSTSPMKRAALPAAANSA